MGDYPFGADFLRSRVHYDPDTGVFTSKHNRFGLSVGQRLGRLTTPGYISFRINGKAYQAHRLAVIYMTGKWPVFDVDHINLDRSDNRWSNIRESSRSQNMFNSRARAHKQHPLKGAYWDGRRSKWYSQIKIGDRRKFLGSFETPEEAHEAYRNAAAHVAGEFARTE